MNIRWFDTETVGLNGPLVTIQWADGDGPIALHESWRTPGRNTLHLIELLADGAVGGFNLSFDIFALARAYCVLRLLPPDRPPTIEGWLCVEKQATEGPCVKPRSAMDVMLFGRKGPTQSLMSRDSIRIRRVPIALAQMLCDHLASSGPRIDPIHFARRKKGMEWRINEKSREDDPEFPDVELIFGGAGGLKPLCRHLLGLEAGDYPVESEKMPNEVEWDIFQRDWTRVIDYHINFFAANETARKYASDDVVLTRALWKHFGSPPPGDDDSILACQIGASRWRGYAVDIGAVEALHAESERRMGLAPRAPKTVLHELHQRMDSASQLVVRDTRTKPTLMMLAEGPDWKGTPAAAFAQTVIDARSAEKDVDTCKKLLQVGRLHPDQKVIGTLSGRMAGAGGLNVTGFPDAIKHCLLLADGALSTLDGADFDAFEVRLAAAVYKDAALTAALAKGKKMHAIFGSYVYGMEYEDIYDDEGGQAVDKETYKASKIGLLAKMYGAESQKLSQVLGLPTEQVDDGIKFLEEQFPGVGEARNRIFSKFCAMRQPGGLGSKVEWHEPAEYIEDFLGGRRYFTLENTICRALFELANKMPQDFHALKIKVSRRPGRVQTPGGAAQSAIFAAAFNIQARAMRAAANDEIQAPGARITKRLQAAIWSHQPAGIHPWVVQPLNEHDSVMVPQRGGESLSDTAAEVVEGYRKQVPLLKLEWKTGLKNWGEK